MCVRKGGRERKRKGELELSSEINYLYNFIQLFQRERRRLRHHRTTSASCWMQSNRNRYCCWCCWRCVLLLLVADVEFLRWLTGLISHSIHENLYLFDLFITDETNCFAVTLRAYAIWVCVCVCVVDGADTMSVWKRLTEETKRTVLHITHSTNTSIHKPAFG